MSRPIKFRIWDKEAKKIRKVNSLHLESDQDGEWCVECYGKSYVTNEGDHDAAIDVIRGHNFELMQFTGLHDKNGKEIWEGDIIQECHIGQVIWDGEGTVRKCPMGVVDWAYSGWGVHQDIKGVVDMKNGSQSEINLDKYDGQFQWEGTEIEVLGNIYENPELLK